MPKDVPHRIAQGLHPLKPGPHRSSRGSTSTSTSTSGTPMERHPFTMPSGGAQRPLPNCRGGFNPQRYLKKEQPIHGKEV